MKTVEVCPKELSTQLNLAEVASISVESFTDHDDNRCKNLGALTLNSENKVLEGQIQTCNNRLLCIFLWRVFGLVSNETRVLIKPVNCGNKTYSTYLRVRKKSSVSLILQLSFYSSLICLDTCAGFLHPICVTNDQLRFKEVMDDSSVRN
jgi:hypothetical protein